MFLISIVVAIVLYIASFFVKPLRKRIPHRVERPREEQVWYRWSRFVQARPWPIAIVGTAVLLLLAAPFLSIRLGFSDYGNYPEDQTVRRAYDLIAEGFGPGTNGPLYITVEGDTASDPEALDAFVATLNETEGMAFSIANPISDEVALVIAYPRALLRTPRRPIW